MVASLVYIFKSKQHRLCYLFRNVPLKLIIFYSVLLGVCVCVCVCVRARARECVDRCLCAGRYFFNVKSGKTCGESRCRLAVFQLTFGHANVSPHISPSYISPPPGL